LESSPSYIVPEQRNSGSAMGPPLVGVSVGITGTTRLRHPRPPPVPEIEVIEIDVPPTPAPTSVEGGSTSSRTPTRHPVIEPSLEPFDQSGNNYLNVANF
jgi:hypothetical protein